MNLYILYKASRRTSRSTTAKLREQHRKGGHDTARARVRLRADTCNILFIFFLHDCAFVCESQAFIHICVHRAAARCAGRLPGVKRERESEGDKVLSKL